MPELLRVIAIVVLVVLGTFCVGLYVYGIVKTGNELDRLTGRRP